MMRKAVKMDELKKAKLEIKKMKKMIDKQVEQLKDLEKMKIEFLNVTSHELKTPLTPIQAYLNLLLKGKLGELTPAQKEGLEVISRNAKRLRLLIWDILDLTRLEAGKMKFNMEEVQLTDIIEDVIKDSESLAKEKNIIINQRLGYLHPIEGDKERLPQVFTNLINNAIKFTPKNGKITIEAERKGYRTIIAVKDTGIGIPKKDLNRIFDKFYQVDRSATRKYPGTGLGLTICKGIIKAHGGEIMVESEPRKGSTFYITLYSKRLGKPIEAFAEAFRK